MSPAAALRTTEGSAGGMDPAGTGREGLSRAGRPRDDAREQVILETAITLLAEVGYDRLTMEAVATAARASKATIYRRWPGKVELVLAALNQRVPRSEEPADTGTLRGDLLAVATAVCADLEGLDGDLLRGMACAARSDPVLAVAMRAQMAERKRPWISAMLSRAVARGDIRSGVKPELVEEIVPAISLMRAMHGDRLDRRFVAHLVDDILLPVLLFDPAASPSRRRPAPSKRRAAASGRRPA